MDLQHLSTLSDDELRAMAKEMKRSELWHALLIGAMVGIILYSVAKNTWGLVTLIPLFLIFRVLHQPERNRTLKKVLAERELDR
ncbi:hypothetical protein [Halomonas denitrificans]|nr:hypothetical protein [Halomonas denitrificans]